MTFSMHDASAPRFARMLRNLDAILARAQTHAAAKKIDPAVLRGYRAKFRRAVLGQNIAGACGQLRELQFTVV